MRVLYLFEPLKQLPCTQSDLIPELEAFRFLVQNLNLLNFPFNSVAFVVKPHPSESKYKYKDINHLFPELNIRLDLDTSLPDLLSWSNVVAGFNTYALTLHWRHPDSQFQPSLQSRHISLLYLMIKLSSLGFFQLNIVNEILFTLFAAQY